MGQNYVWKYQQTQKYERNIKIFIIILLKMKKHIVYLKY